MAAVQGPDGRVYNFPDDARPEEISEYLARNALPAPPAKPPSMMDRVGGTVMGATGEALRGLRGVGLGAGGLGAIHASAA